MNNTPMDKLMAMNNIIQEKQIARINRLDEFKTFVDTFVYIVIQNKKSNNREYISAFLKKIDYDTESIIILPAFSDVADETGDSISIKEHPELQILPGGSNQMFKFFKNNANLIQNDSSSENVFNCQFIVESTHMFRHQYKKFNNIYNKLSLCDGKIVYIPKEECFLVSFNNPEVDPDHLKEAACQIKMKQMLPDRVYRLDDIDPSLIISSKINSNILNFKLVN